MKRIIKNNYKIMLGFVLGILLSVTSVYAIDAYIESKKVSYDNKYTNKTNTQEAIDELYERSGIHKEKWVDPILNGADPVLKSPLIPVEIKPNGEVYYANLNSEWYNYSEKRWANAVILIDNPSNTNYKVGDHIIEDDIESYFVWIPRFQYKIWDLAQYNKALDINQLTNNKEDVENSFWKVAGNNSKIIDIQFGTYDKYPKMAEPTSVGVYYTHPAFILGNKNLNGIWVGKFETGGSTSKLIIKPNIVSWRWSTFKTYFDAAKGYKTNLDSHMIKNTEWGAVAYLSHSVYGIGTEVNINNNGEYKTGYSATASADQRLVPGITGKTAEPDKTQPWNTPTGYLASTTGNISGIYDMSGGAWEYVAARIKGITFDGDIDPNLLSEEIENGYIDGYPADSTFSSYDKRILGDATGEMGPFYKYNEKVISVSANSWYADFSTFIAPSLPCLIRGGDQADGVMAGQFFFRAESTSGKFSFRIVLVP